ncbi:MAG: T9SS type A sorting domain-containing protein [Ignavibacteriales bacterium]|nr:T9SS type A sorting domain-containing protein [Ignavibacteriales bacterium]
MNYEFALGQNYPNPFNPSTTIEFSIPKTSFVSLKVYDILGREVSNLISELKNAGNYNINFNADNFLSSGLYFYQLKVDNFIETKK